MSIEQGYYLMDLVATLFEQLCLCILLTSVVPYKNNVGKLITIFLVNGMIVFSLTFLNVNIFYKFLFQIVYFIVCYRFVFLVRFSLAGNCVILYYLSLLVADNTTLLACTLFKLDPFTLVNNATYAKWYVYVISHIILAGAVLLIKKLITPLIKSVGNRKVVPPFIGAVILIILIEVFYVFSTETSEFYLLLCGTLAILGMFLIAMFLYIYVEKLTSVQKEYERETLRNTMLEQQYLFYKEKLDDEQKVRSIYHDMKNHLLVLRAQVNDSQEAQHSIEALSRQTVEYESYYHTGNDFLDVIMKDKWGKAKEIGIDLTVNVNLKDGNFLDLLDISTIFGNALDNAIEACEKLSEDKRLLTVKASRNRDMLLIVVQNNADFTASADGGTTKQDTFMHGFGMLNIKKAVSKYDGQCITKVEDSVFTLKIMIPIPIK